MTDKLGALPLRGRATHERSRVTPSPPSVSVPNAVWQPIETAPVGDQIVFAYFGHNRPWHGYAAVVEQFQWDGMPRPLAKGWPGEAPHATNWLRLPDDPYCASAIEARRAETAETGSVADESAVAESQTPNNSGTTP